MKIFGRDVSVRKIKWTRRRRTCVLAILVIVVLSGIFLGRKIVPHADVTSTTGIASTYAFLNGKVTLDGDGSPAKGFTIIVDNHNASIQDDGQYSLLIPDAASIDGGTGQADIHFVRNSDDSQWQIANSFEQQTYLTAGYFPMDFVISQIAPATKVNTVISPYSAYGVPGTSVNLRVILYGYGGASRVGGKKISYKMGSTYLGTAVTDDDGIASLAYNVPTNMAPGNYTISNGFDGRYDLMYNTTVRSVPYLNIVQSKHGVSFSLYAASGSPGSSATLKTLLYSYGKPLPGKTVTFVVDGIAAGSGVSDANGVAADTTLFYIPTNFTIGTHNVTVIFDGSSDPIFASGIRTEQALTVK